jgi:WXXGXW repeat (2 copies)
MCMRNSVLAALALVLAVAFAPATAVAQVSIGIGVNITLAPPELPDYDQPEIPGPGYIWTPGYWAWGDDGYYWVPGTWIEPPVVGVLWTPGYWGYGDGVYVWHEGYWGPHIGFYGGVNYGFGYVGVGYLGGSWRGGVFAYNTAVTNVGSVHITNVYNQTIINNNVNVTKVSFNGGANGVHAQPTAQEQVAAREQHVAPTTAQVQHVTAASHNKALLASVNQGKPAIAATGKAGQFSGHGVIAAHAAGKDFHAPNNGPKTGNINAATTHQNPAVNPKTLNANVHPEEHGAMHHEEHATQPHPNVATQPHPNVANNPPKVNPPRPPAPQKPAAAAAKPHGPPPKKEKKT